MRTYRKLTICTLLLALSATVVFAQPASQNVPAPHRDTVQKSPRLVIGGYGEAVYIHNFFSDNFNRYSRPADYVDKPGHSRVDLPHAVLMLGYDFGKGWSFGTEIEFEHGGTEAAVELEGDEAGEFEKEIERGGEVALEQFWIQKSFGKGLNLKMGHLVVPVGMTNRHHLPTEFYGVYRPEGENTILPCTWHETGVSLWGDLGNWRYEAMLLPSLNSNMFNASGWVHNGSASAYEFRVANRLAGAGRLEYSGIRNLRLGLSGFIGNTFNNDILTNTATKYDTVKGTLMIGSFDFRYQNRWLTLRGNADYGFLNDAAIISAYNKSQDHSANSPYPHTMVGKAAWAAALEAGVDLLAFRETRIHSDRKFILYGRYEHYDSYIPAGAAADIEWADRQVVSGGVNYYPISQIAVKAEAGVRLLKSQYNDEPFAAVGITWSGMFKR